MSSDLTSNEIIIPINDSTNANKNFEEKNLIQKKSFLKLEHLIEKNLGILKNGMYTVDDRFHEAITILGARGSGKTSFLLNLENTLSESVSNDLSFLKILDPTLYNAIKY